METELLSCPFCGKPAVEETVNDICCGDRRCLGNLSMGSREEWNTRAGQPEAAKGERERIVKLIQSLYRRLPAVKPAEVSDGIWEKSIEAAEEFNGAIDEVLAAIESTVNGETNAITD